MAAGQITPQEAARVYLTERANELGKLIVRQRAEAERHAANANNANQRADAYRLELEGICAIRAAILDGAA